MWTFLATEDDELDENGEKVEERRVPLFVAQAQVGQSFAELTRIGLARAKGMVAFYTSDYCAYWCWLRNLP